MLCAPTSPSLLESPLTTLLSGPVRSSCFCPPWVRRPQGWLCPWQPGLVVSTNCPTSPPPGLSSSQSLAVLLSRCSVHRHQPPRLQSPAPHCPPGPPGASLSSYLDPLLCHRAFAQAAPLPLPAGPPLFHESSEHMQQLRKVPLLLDLHKLLGSQPPAGQQCPGAVVPRQAPSSASLWLLGPDTQDSWSMPGSACCPSARFQNLQPSLSADWDGPSKGLSMVGTELPGRVPESGPECTQPHN